MREARYMRLISWTPQCGSEQLRQAIISDNNAPSEKLKILNHQHLDFIYIGKIQHV